MNRVAIVFSAPFMIRTFLADQIEALCSRYEVWVMTNVSSTEELPLLPEAARILPVRIERKPSPVNDLKALVDLTRAFRRHRFDLVHSITPKAGLLAMNAAFAARVPVRIHTFQGEVWATRRRLSRKALKTADKLTAALATDILVVSESERRFLLREGVIAEEKSRVLASGSICGVDTKRFKPDPAARAAVRRQLGIEEDDMLFLFVGRLIRDKGIQLLVEAFRRLADGGKSAHLAFVGPDEEGLADLLALGTIPGVRYVGESFEPERFMAAADVLCLPSRREGFPVVVIEAASAGLPAVASNVYGITDAIIDGTTGLLHKRDDVDDLARCMSLMQTDPNLRQTLGAAARKRVLADFRQELITRTLVETYEALL